MDSKWSSSGFVIAPFGKGRNAIQSKHANDLVDALNVLGRIKIKRADKDEVFYSDTGLTLQLKDSTDSTTSTSLSVKAAQITAINADSVTVSLWDESDGDFTGESVNVAKPVSLRNRSSETIWSVAWTYSYASSQERTRAATGFSATKQRVFPDYKVNDEIYVTNTGENTGVSGCEYIDLNIDARRWLTETKGCDDDGEPVYSFMDRSPWAASAIGSNFD